MSESPFRSATPATFTSHDREAHALREHSFVQNTEARLDEFLAQGREVLDNLVDQRNMLKGTQRRLLDAANTLGLSRDVIGWIERRRYVFINVGSGSLQLTSMHLKYTGHVYFLWRSCFHFHLLFSHMEISGLIYLQPWNTRLPSLLVGYIHPFTLLILP